ncbi:MAG: hypothetical protein WA705_23800 [Candidatus Ozemobacteraceae bacterium]
MTNKREYTIKSEVQGKIFKIHSTGPLGEDAGQELESLVKEGLAKNHRHFVFNFGYAKAISSPAVAAILNAIESIVDGNGGKACVTGLTELNMKVFEMVGILLYAEMCATLPEAEVRVLLEAKP